jgi:uncharacterized protein YndB with AHSA1/START domain
MPPRLAASTVLKRAVGGWKTGGDDIGCVLSPAVDPLSIRCPERTVTLFPKYAHNQGGQMAEQPTQDTTPTTVPSVIKSVVVDVPIATAFSIFTERPIDWWPADHVLVDKREDIVFQPFVGGRYYERSADGSEIDWGRITVWDPPNRVAMTWRIDGRWQPIFDDEMASVIDVRFTALGPSTTEVELGHVELHKHGDAAEKIRTALDGPSPGTTLANYARAVAAHQNAA